MNSTMGPTNTPTTAAWAPRPSAHAPEGSAPVCGGLSEPPGGHRSGRGNRYSDEPRLDGKSRGRPAEVVCPTCQGLLAETQAGDFLHFRCHIGHAFSLQSLAHEKDEMARALWAAVRSLEGGAALSKRCAAAERHVPLQRRFADKADTLARQADVIREILLRGPGSPLSQRP